jgi:hypothetical protein
VGKYLQSFRYVPENFDAILVGSSMSGNWNLAGIEGLHVYNESLNGGNVVEEKCLVDAALSRSGISTAFLIVHPALTISHNFETVRLDDKLKLASLGSVSLSETYRDMIGVRWLHKPREFDHNGTEDFGSYAHEMNAVMKRLWQPAEAFDIDPIARAAYRELVAELRAHKVQIAFVVPPMYEDILRAKRAAFDKYVQQIRADVATDADEWLDFTGEDYAAFRRDKANFGDGIHFTSSSSARFVSDLNAKVAQAIARGRLRPGGARSE